MSNWHCYKCKVAVEEDEIDTQFAEYDFSYDGLICPECNDKWFPEEVVIDEIASSEADAEAKMA